MNILLRHTLRSVGKNKLQAVVIFFTVVAVTMMMFAAFSMTGVFYNVNVSEYRRMAGDSDMLIGNRSGGETFARATVEAVVRDNPDVTDVDYFLRGSSVMRAEEANYPVLVEATDLEKFAKPENGFYPVGSVPAGEYPSALVSERFAEDYSVRLGSVLELLSPVSKKYVRFNITHILEPRGFFGSSVANQIVVDLRAVDNMGLVNNVYLTFRDPALYSVYETKFKELLPTANVEDALNEESVRAIARNNTTLLAAAVVLITVVMMLILFSSYLIIARTRTNEMALFKAAGATPKQTVAILLSEVLCYGVAGSLLGVILGRVVMGWAVSSLLPYATDAVSYEFWKFAASFLIGVTVSALSALFPILSVAKKTIRELTSGGVKTVKKGNPVIFAALTLAVAGFAAAAFLTAGVAATALLLAAVPFLVLWLVSALRYAIRFFGFCVSGFARKGGGALAAKTAKRSGQILSVATLVAVVSAFAFMVVSTIDLVVVAVTPYESRYTADVVLTADGTETPSAREAAKSEFLKLPGVTQAESFGSIDLEARSLNGEKINDCTMFAVSDGRGIYSVSNNADPALAARFDAAERPIVLNYDMTVRLGLTVGDSVRLSRTVLTSSTETVEYLDGIFTVVGLEYTATEWDRVGILRAGDLVSQGKEWALSGGIFLTTDDPDAAFRAARTLAERDGKYLALRFRDWAEASSKGLGGVETLLKFAELLFALVAALGILNVSIVAFLDRKREFTVYRLVGMDEREYFRFHFAEGGIAALSGTAVGLVVAFFINRLLPVLASLVSKYLKFPVFPAGLFLIPIAVAAVFLVLWAVLALSFRKDFSKSEFRAGRTGVE